MVICWVLNSLVPKISKSCTYVASAKQLWDELGERFGQISGPLVFQLQRELNNISQEYTSVSVYFSKLKRVWDELKSVKRHLLALMEP